MTRDEKIKEIYKAMAPEKYSQLLWNIGRGYERNSIQLEGHGPVNIGDVLHYMEANNIYIEDCYDCDRCLYKSNILEGREQKGESLESQPDICIDFIHNNLLNEHQT